METTTPLANITRAVDQQQNIARGVERVHRPYNASVLLSADYLYAVPPSTVVKKATVQCAGRTVVVKTRVDDKFAVMNEKHSYVLMVKTRTVDLQPYFASPPVVAAIKRSRNAVDRALYVLLDGDKDPNTPEVLAVDIGEAVDCCALSEWELAPPTSQVQCAVTSAEHRQWLDAVTKEESELLVQLKELVDQLRCRAEIHRCAFQYDKRKVTVWFSTNRNYIPFRRISAAINSKYKCRVWLERIPIVTTSSSPAESSEGPSVSPLSTSEEEA